MKLLSLVVRASVILLASSAVLVVLGLFNESLDWDIFSPAAERVLYGIFGSCLALAGIGAATCIVIGIQEMVVSVRRLVDRANPEAPTAAEAPRRSYVMALSALLVLLILTVAGFNVANRRVTAHRLDVFKLVARDQMRQLGPRMTAEVEKIGRPCGTCGTPTLAEIFETMRGLSFVDSATLYFPEPDDDAVLWRYPGDNPYDEASRLKMARFFIAKDDDRAVKLALQGDPAWINQKNDGPGFVWYQVLKDAQGKNRAVLVIEGDPNESFREYAAGAEAEKKRG